MDFRLTEQQELFIKGVGDFAQGEIAPRARQMDRDGAMDPELLQKLNAQGFFGLCFPESHGGLGLDTVTYGLVIAELARADAGGDG